MGLNHSTFLRIRLGDEQDKIHIRQRRQESEEVRVIPIRLQYRYQGSDGSGGEPVRHLQQCLADGWIEGEGVEVAEGRESVLLRECQEELSVVFLEEDGELGGEGQDMLDLLHLTPCVGTHAAYSTSSWSTSSWYLSLE